MASFFKIGKFKLLDYDMMSRICLAKKEHFGVWIQREWSMPWSENSNT